MCFFPRWVSLRFLVSYLVIPAQKSLICKGFCLSLYFYYTICHTIFKALSTFSTSLHCLLIPLNSLRFSPFAIHQHCMYVTRFSQSTTDPFKPINAPVCSPACKIKANGLWFLLRFAHKINYFLLYSSKKNLIQANIIAYLLTFWNNQIAFSTSILLCISRLFDLYCSNAFLFTK